ncbi:N-acetylmuramoyl-L-alanine amidase [Bacillus sp. F19]|nr:N-acetylmuramoyl-L-alanine amidase [Bacillus sp. F19]
MHPEDNQLFGDDANDTAVSVELCRPGNFKEVYDRYVWYHVYLCRKFGLDPLKKIVPHSKLDPRRRTDPESWLKPNGVTWSQFIKEVKYYYDNWSVKPAANTTKK